MRAETVRRTIGLVALILSATVVVACGPSRSGEATDCAKTPAVVSDGVMAHARTDFRFGKSTIARLELRRAVTVPLPDGLRKYGATDVVVLSAAAFLAHPESSAYAGAIDTYYVAVDAQGKPIASLGRLAPQMFDLAKPTDSTWTAQVENSAVVQAARTCVED
jgi:hypothetical protein